MKLLTVIYLQVITPLNLPLKVLDHLKSLLICFHILSQNLQIHRSLCLDFLSLIFLIWMKMTIDLNQFSSIIRLKSKKKINYLKKSLLRLSKQMIQNIQPAQQMHSDKRNYQPMNHLAQVEETYLEKKKKQRKRNTLEEGLKKKYQLKERK